MTARRRFRPREEVTFTVTATVADDHSIGHERCNLVRVTTAASTVETVPMTFLVALSAVGLYTEPGPDAVVVDANGDEWRRYGTDPGGRHWRCRTPAPDGSGYAREAWHVLRDVRGPVQRVTATRRGTDGGTA